MSTYKISYNIECEVNEKGEAVIQPAKTDFFHGSGFPIRLPPGNLKNLPSEVSEAITSIKFDGIDTIGSKFSPGFPNLQTVEFCGKHTVGTERTIGAEAFANCKNLKNVIGLENVKEIGSGAFENTGLTGVITLENHQRAGYDSFARTNIEGVILKGGILYPNAFGSNPNLKDVKIDIDDGAQIVILGDPFEGSNPNIIIENRLVSPHLKDLFDRTIGELKKLGYNIEENNIEETTEERTPLSAQIESVEAETLATKTPADSDVDKDVDNDNPSLNPTENYDPFNDGDR